MTDLRKLLIEARAWIVANEKHESVCPTRVMGTWGRCRCGFVSIIGRIDAALSEPVEPIGYIDAEQLRRWNVLKGTEYESPERCYMPFSRKPWKSEMSDCSLAVYAAPASQWRRVEDWCKWSPEDAVEMPDTWRGDCGILWTFTEGGPHENGVKFCHNCGKQVALPLPALPEGDK